MCSQRFVIYVQPCGPIKKKEYIKERVSTEPLSATATLRIGISFLWKQPCIAFLWVSPPGKGVVASVSVTYLEQVFAAAAPLNFL